MPPDEEGTGAPSPAEVQRRVLRYWETTGVLARAYSGTPGGPVFRFTEGPPGVNGPPHLGHVEPRTLKDVQLRYRRMRGYHIVSSMAGWDCHGLPVELEIEKRHGLRSKKEIEAYGVERFCEECRTTALSFASVWREMSSRLGYWLDYDHAYRTMDPPYIESVWWALKTLFDRGLLEKGHYVLPYCPRCETTLSSHEVAQGYHETTDPSVTVRLPLEGDSRDLLVWTTTPWTLPANLLVAAHPDLEYSVVRVARGACGRPRLGGRPPVLPRWARGARTAPRPATSPGGRTARRSTRPGPDRAATGSSSTTSSPRPRGRGSSHIAPSFGPDDYRIGAREKVGVFDPLDSRGVFGDAVPLVRGKLFKVADPILTRDLAAARARCSAPRRSGTSIRSAGGATTPSSTAPSIPGSCAPRASPTRSSGTTPRSAGYRPTSGTDGSATSSRRRRTGRSRAVATGGPRYPSGSARTVTRRASAASPSSPSGAARRCPSRSTPIA